MDQGDGFRTTALAFTLLIAAGPVAAQSWVGISAGSSEFDDFCDGFGGAVNCDDDDTGMKAFIGLQPIPELGIEAFWVDLGEVRARDRAGDRLEVSADGIGVALLPTFRVSRELDLYGRFGFFAWEADADLRVAGQRTSDTDDGTDAVYGLGARLHVTDAFGLRAEWEQYEVDDEDVTLFSVGAELWF